MIFSALFLVKGLEEKNYLIEATLHFFKSGALRLLFPYIFALSYIHIIQDDRRREVVFCILCIIFYFAALFYLPPLLALGIGIHFGFSLCLILFIKKNGYGRWSIAITSIGMTLVIRAVIDLYPLVLQEKFSLASAPAWQYSILGVLVGRVLISIPLLISNREQAKDLSVVALMSYFLNPVFLFYFFPISPAEYTSSFRWNSPEKPAITTTALRGWVLIFFSIALTSLLVPFYMRIGLLDAYPFLASIKLALLIIAKVTLTAGLLKICGFEIREPFRGILGARTPMEVWSCWNVYTREWLIKFAYFPAFRMGANFYGAFLWTFFISGVYNGARRWVLPAAGLPLTAANIWLWGLWLSLIIFMYRKFRERVVASKVIAMIPSFMIPTLRWIVILGLIVVPGTLLQIFFPELK